MVRALLVGINDYIDPQVNDLNGCVNDITFWYNILITKFKVLPKNIRTLLNRRAKKTEITRRLVNMVSINKEDDKNLFIDSSHGTYMRDRNGDELSDHTDECIVCADCHDEYGLLSDDEIAKIFSRAHPKAMNIIIADACHSGTMNKTYYKKGHTHADPIIQQRFHPMPLDIRHRETGCDKRSSFLGINTAVNSVATGMNMVAGSRDNTICLAACGDAQTSIDGYYDGNYHGAFTWCVEQILKKNINFTYKTLMTEIKNNIKNYDTDQIPQIDGANWVQDLPIFT